MNAKSGTGLVSSSRVLSGFLALLAALVVVASVPARADAPFARVTVLVHGYRVYVELPEGEEGAGLPVTLELRDEAGERVATARTRTGPDGRAELALRSRGVRAPRAYPIRPGHSLRVTRGEGTGREASIQLTPPVLSAAADPDADRLSGLAPPGATLAVTAVDPQGRFAFRSVDADPRTGAWSLDLAGELRLLPGSTGAVSTTVDETTYQTSWLLPTLESRRGDAADQAGVLDLGAAGLRLRAAAGSALLARVSPADGADALPAEGRAVAWAGGGETTLVQPRDADGEPRRLRGGDRLEIDLRGGQQDASLAASLPRVEDLRVEPDAGRVAGRWADGPDRALRARRGAELVEGRTDAEGAFALGFSAPFAPDEPVDLLFEGPDGAFGPLEIRLRAHAPDLLGMDDRRAALGLRGTAGTAARLVLLDARGVTRGEADGVLDERGRLDLVIYDGRGLPLARAPGDRLRLELEGETREWDASPLVVRLGRREASGEAAPDSLLRLRVGETLHETRADGEGRWALTLDAPGPAPGETVDVTAEPAGGPPSRLRAPAFRASAQAGGDRVRVEGPPGLSARAELWRGAALLARGACEVIEAACEIELRDPAGAAPRMREGDDLLVFPSQGATAAIRIIELSAHIDPNGSDVVGAAPRGAAVRIDFLPPAGHPSPLGSVVGVDENGVYDYELPIGQWELVVPGIASESIVSQPDGHRVFATGVMEQVRLAWPEGRVEGLVEPGRAVTASLEAEGARLAGGRAVADGAGRFTLWLEDAAGRRRVPAPGERLRVEHARRTHEMPLPALAAWTLDADGRIAGATEPGLALRAVHPPRWRPDEGDAELQRGVADGDGLFVLPPPDGTPLGPAGGLAPRLALTLPGGDELILPRLPGARSTE